MVTSEIKAFIRPGLRLRPPEIIFNQITPGETATARFTIADGYPDPGIEVIGVDVADTEKLKVDIERIGISRQGEISNVGVASDQGFDPSTLFTDRYRVTVTYHAPGDLDGERVEIIRVNVDDSNIGSVELPVFIRPKRDSVRLIPPLLAVTSRGGRVGTIRREVVLVSDREVITGVEVLNRPPWLQVSVLDPDEQSSLGRRKIIRIVMRPDGDRLEKEYSELAFRVERGQTVRRLVLPVRFVP